MPIRPRSRPAFTAEELEAVKRLLASRVARMGGRKLEEGDWTEAYCKAKGFPVARWSNLSIDVVQPGLGVEQKMLRLQQEKLQEAPGRTFMHPAATRSIRISSLTGDATAVARDVLVQYRDLILARTQLVRAEGAGREPDMRAGWLLWEPGLRDFVYFEEEMLPPNPDDYRAEWRDSGGGRRKSSRNLWVFEADTGKKRYSITTEAGAKIQPYFDVPPASDPNLYRMRVQSERVSGGVRLWITDQTATSLRRLLGGLEAERLDAAVERLEEPSSTANSVAEGEPFGAVTSLIVSDASHQKLVAIADRDASDEDLIQKLIEGLAVAE